METNENPKLINEGKATILGEGNVFYNPVQQFNRDLSILVLNAYFELFEKEKDNQKNSNESCTEIPDFGESYKV